ncbi:aminoglycoside phosphotransferase [Streptomyces abikoensis]|uniref:aminoglycoside phosphotransferase n=1 Tax=Streptomyces abikoensis TaxID=97398 RepID=UPI0033DD4FE3
MARVDWLGLPEESRAAVEARAGAVRVVEDVPHGITCRFAAVLSTASGQLFVKGVPSDDAWGRAGQAMEAAVNAAVVPVSPRLLWRVEAGGWDLVAFEAVEARHADLSPGSPDLPLVAAVLERAQDLKAPAGVELPQYVDRELGGAVSAAERELLLGDALLHTDTNPHNLLVGADRAYLVDWALPAVGPSWIDAAEAAMRLMDAGCSASEALAWAAQFASWAGADPAAVEVFVRGTCRARVARLGERDAQVSNAQCEALLKV